MHRTYVRRRFAVFATATVLVMALGGPMARGLGVVSDPLVPVSSRSYVVRPGDTLWSIAFRIAPDRDPREVIAELERRNEAATGGLAPGQVLSIPSPS
ncbi:MAG: LysM peptidoglycan-binding domain-containing protein [Actinomycetota bacterium]